MTLSFFLFLWESLINLQVKNLSPQGTSSNFLTDFVRFSNSIFSMLKLFLIFQRASFASSAAFFFSLISSTSKESIKSFIFKIFWSISKMLSLSKSKSFSFSVLLVAYLRWHALCSSLIFSLLSFSYIIFSSLFFLYISQNWVHLHSIFVFLVALSFAVFCALPESPKYLA